MKGFFPKEPPLREYQKSSPSLDRLQEIAHNLPKLLLTSQVQPTVESLTKNDLSIQEILDSNSESCLLYTSPSPRDQRGSRMPSSA